MADQHDLEGVVSKRINSRYEAGRRSAAWIKTPLRYAQEVVGGWKPGQGRRSGTVGSLLLGAYDEVGLISIGHVGTSSTDKALPTRNAVWLNCTDRAARSLPRFHASTPGDARWVDPLLVGEVEFRQWTSDGRLRHPSWRGLRTGLDPASIRRVGG